MGRDGAQGVERDDAEWQLAGTARPAGKFSRATERVSWAGFAGTPARPHVPSGRPADDSDAHLPGAVADLLAAATAPARPHELAGEEAAVAAFRRTGAAPVRKPRRRALLAKLLTVKVAAAFAVSAAGGVAVAAAAGTLPDLPGRSGIITRPEPPAPPPAQPHPSRPVSRPGPAAPPSLTDLCRTWAADKHHRLDGKAYTPLVSAAGGGKKVPAYCADLLAKADRTGSPTPTAPPTPIDGQQPGDPKRDRPKVKNPKGKDPRPKDEKTKNPKPGPHLLPTDGTPSSPPADPSDGPDQHQPRSGPAASGLRSTSERSGAAASGLRSTSERSGAAASGLRSTSERSGAAASGLRSEATREDAVWSAAERASDITATREDAVREGPERARAEASAM